ncbi:MAG: PAS domain S-box protein, partial [Planctomycetaceae bacterium]|nr:PAS domain S-box protein [Planctomycetaceae bacterium]
MMGSGVRVYGISLGALAAAVAFRALLEPVMEGTLPLVTLFGAVAVSVYFGGYRPAILVTILGYLACAYLYIEPRGTFGVTNLRGLVGMLAYLLTCAVIIGFGEALLTARRRASIRGETLRVTLASMGDAVITTDKNGCVTNLNAVAESLTGWRFAEAAGRPLESVFRIIHETSRQSVENPALRALREGHIVGLANHTLLVSKDKTERPIDDSAAPIRDREGQIVGSVLIFRDVTDRRQREQATAQELTAARFLASIIESSSDAIVSKSMDGIIQSWNPAAEQLFGHSAQHAVGRHISLV